MEYVDQNDAHVMNDKQYASCIVYALQIHMYAHTGIHFDLIKPTLHFIIRYVVGFLISRTGGYM